VLLDENGRLKLGGFGLSRRLSDINKTPVTNLPPVSRRRRPAWLLALRRCAESQAGAAGGVAVAVAPGA
jgi:hypothetical protein